jgi:hypothetical protein
MDDLCSSCTELQEADWVLGRDPPFCTGWVSG